MDGKQLRRLKPELESFLERYSGLFGRSENDAIFAQGLEHPPTPIGFRLLKQEGGKLRRHRQQPIPAALFQFRHDPQHGPPVCEVNAQLVSPIPIEVKGFAQSQA